MTEIEAKQTDGDDAVDDAASGSESAREPSEHEKRLRRELVRVREQARLAQSERDAVMASAYRERDIAITQAREEAKQRILHSELKAYAVRAGIVDLDGLRLADLNGLALDESGDVVGADEVISTLKSSKPYLFHAQSDGADQAAVRKYHHAPAPASPRAVDARALTREEWQAERAKFLRR